jgi:hypothetical protein
LLLKIGANLPATKEQLKKKFKKNLKEFVKELNDYISTNDGQWTIKGFIDLYKNIYTISSDTKIVSKILEIHLFPKILEFANNNNYKLVLATHQNYYPDITFVSKANDKIKYAVDIKTTYRDKNPEYCRGFTLGSHGNYFMERDKSKNITFPYNQYSAHICLGVIYSRIPNSTIDETKRFALSDLHSIISVAKDFNFFVAEKWKIASDQPGSYNTANIGSIQKIEDIINENGMFAVLGEDWFDDYWMNFNKITITDKSGNTKKIRNLLDFVDYRGGDRKLIVSKAKRIIQAKKMDEEKAKKARKE